MKIKVDKRIKGITIAAAALVLIIVVAVMFIIVRYTCQREDEWLYILWHRQEYG